LVHEAQQTVGGGRELYFRALPLIKTSKRLDDAISLFAPIPEAASIA
jgi:hypothetical protein